MFNVSVSNLHSFRAAMLIESLTQQYLQYYWPFIACAAMRCDAQIRPKRYEAQWASTTMLTWRPVDVKPRKFVGFER